MSRLFVMAGAICASMMLGSIAYAQQPAAAPAPPAPPPYGPAVTIDQAKKAVAAALAEAKKSPYLYTFAVVDPTGSLVYFEKMDGAIYASTEIAMRKARTAATFKRPTKAFFDAMESGHPFVATLTPELTASIGGIPLMVDGKIIGAIGVSGSPSGPTDLAPAQAGADALK
jgi:glc operon protein GlcG